MLNKSSNMLKVCLIDDVSIISLFLLLIFTGVLSRSIATANATEINPNDIGKLIDFGFTDQQARFALKKTK